MGTRTQLPLTEYVPAVHVLQTLDPSVEYIPDGHGAAVVAAMEQ